MDCKDNRIRKPEFVAKTQLLSKLIIFKVHRFKQKIRENLRTVKNGDFLKYKAKISKKVAWSALKSLVMNECNILNISCCRWSMSRGSCCSSWISMPRLVEGITPRKGLMAPQNNFLDKIAKRFKGTRKFMQD